MELQIRLETLLSLARELEIDIRSEPLGGDGGGLCVLKGRRVLFVDTSADVDTRYERTAAALAGLPALDSRYLPPEIREDLHRIAEGTAS